MALSAAQAGLGSVIIVASVTFFALYITLYPFVINYFREKTETERTRRGMAYVRFFRMMMAISAMAFITVIVGTAALWYESAEALAGATLVFLFLLFFGSYNVLSEISSSAKFVEPYARDNLYQQAHDKEFAKVMG